MKRSVMERKVGGDYLELVLCVYSSVVSLQRRHERPSRFNLEDEEEGLTHYGQSIGDMETFDEVQISEDEVEGIRKKLQ